jgi:3-oxoacyl-[acyl-carrier-protein] synthase-3
MNILSLGIRFNLTKASCALPSGDAISNLDIFKYFPRTADKSLSFQQKMSDMVGLEFGFFQRYWTHLPWKSLDEATETSETLAVKALSKLFKSHPDTAVDAFILGSTTNTRYSGSQATSVLGQLALCCPAYDFKAGCSTSLAAFSLAYGLMALGYQQVLVCCAETMSKIIDPDNEKTWLGVADGAAALLFELSDEGHFCIEKSIYSTDGRYVDAYTTRGQLPPTLLTLNQEGYFLSGDEQLLKQLALEKYTAMLDALLDEVDKKEIKWIISHQVNRRLIIDLIQRYGLHHAKLLWDADKIGNIGGASISYTLARAINEGLFNEQGRLLMMSVGGGLTFATQLLSYTP